MQHHAISVIPALGFIKRFSPHPHKLNENFGIDQKQLRLKLVYGDDDYISPLQPPKALLPFILPFEYFQFQWILIKHCLGL